MAASAAVPAVGCTTWRGEAAVVLRAGDISATFLPSVSMLGVSFTHAGDELLAPVAPLARFRTGHVTGIPLLHPWANRLSQWSYTVGRTRVDVPRDTHVDKNGLPIHGTVHGTPFDVVSINTTSTQATLDARLDATADERLMRAFPFPHTLTVRAAVARTGLTLTTTLHATGRRAVPMSFGYHPYFRLPGAPRSRWWLRLPPRNHVHLDERQIPDGPAEREAANDGPIGRRTFDDHYRLGRDHRFELAAARRRLTVTFGRAYPFAQIYVPPGKDFACIEPMTAPVNALVDGTAPLVAPGTSRRAVWRCDVSTE